MATKAQIENILSDMKGKADYGIFRLFSEMTEKEINNAIKIYAYGCKKQDIVAILDTTVFSSGKEGFLFTDKAIYSPWFKKDKTIKGPLFYEKLASVQENKNQKNHIIFQFNDGKTVDIFLTLYEPFIFKMIDEVLKLKEEESKAETATEKILREETERRKAEGAKAEAGVAAKPKKTAKKAPATVKEDVLSIEESPAKQSSVMSDSDPIVQIVFRMLAGGKLTNEEIAEYTALPLADVQKLAAKVEAERKAKAERKKRSI